MEDSGIAKKEIGFPSNIPLPDDIENWSQEYSAASLNELHEATISAVQNRIDWYDDYAKWYGARARAIRRAALFFAAIGALTPLLEPVLGLLSFADSSDPVKSQGLPVDNIGYLMIAVAGVLVGYDNFFGFSDSWMRFRVTQAELVRKLAAFRYDWAARMAHSPEKFERSILSELVLVQHRFVDSVEAAIENETMIWANALRSRIVLFDKQGGHNTYQATSGAVSVHVTNWAELDQEKTNLSVNGQSVSIASNGTAHHTGLPPGRYKVALETRDGIVEKEVDVEFGKVVTIKLSAELNTDTQGD